MLLAGLFSSLYFQALAALGKFGMKKGEKVELRIDVATTTMEILDCLFRKLEGRMGHDLEKHAEKTIESIKRTYREVLREKDSDET